MKSVGLKKSKSVGLKESAGHQSPRHVLQDGTAWGTFKGKRVKRIREIRVRL